jgi:hypothetical protein
MRRVSIVCDLPGRVFSYSPAGRPANGRMLPFPHAENQDPVELRSPKPALIELLLAIVPMS